MSNERTTRVPGGGDLRPSPEAFLDLIEQSRRGRLKIYVGHAAGTGKTVQMLREANDLLARGRDVVGAYVETHGREGTETAVGRLPLIPRRRAEYKGSVIEEMDMDAVLARRPDIAVVDELPHSNVAPNSRHPKRWQDVEELLDAGISVITAMNIQHLESLGPVIEKLTGVKVRETVPDSFLAGADQIVNLDLSATDLRGRMRRGEIYSPEKVETALNNFFTRENLTNLRELALREVVRFLDQGRRHAAASPGEELHLHQHQSGSTNDPARSGGDSQDAALLSPLAEVDIDPVVMVAMSSRPPDVRNLLRKAAAISHRLNTHWYLAYVETPRESSDHVDATTQRILMNNITLAKDLGATVIRLKGTDVAVTLAGFAREYGVTHAIFGSAGPPATAWGLLLQPFRPDLVSRFHRLAPDIDLHICGKRAP
jgi:two-component system, OmpR family, sensor histidine kinase KdpD